MKISKPQLTISETDAVSLMVAGGLCLLLALVLHHSYHFWLLFCVGLLNFFNGWRLRRRFAAAKKAQDHADS
jgi:hypothetical protein